MEIVVQIKMKMDKDLQKARTEVVSLAFLFHNTKNRICSAISSDICEAIDKLLRQLSTQHGITLNDSRQLTIYHDRRSLTAADAIKKVVGEQDFLIHRILLFKKSTEFDYEYPDVFRYENNILVLKALVVSEADPIPTGHFRAYCREFFPDNMIMISDTQIKHATIEDAYAGS